MATAPDTDVVARIVAGGLLVSGFTPVEDTNIFRGPVRAPSALIPHKALFVLASGGPPPSSFIDGGTGTDYIYSFVQVRARSDEQAFDAGQTFARAVRDRLHKASMVGYIEVRVREAEPLYLGQDEQGHHEWAINVELEHRR